MSIGNNHMVTVFDTLKSKALDETQRLSLITRKNTEKTLAANNGVKLVSQCVSIPTFSLTSEQILGLKIYVQDMVESAQDSLIRSLIDAGATSIADEQITFDCIVSHMTMERASSRLKKEAILHWWNDEVLPLFIAYSEPKLGIITGQPVTEVQAKKLEVTCNAWRDLFASVAGRSLIDKDKINHLKNMLSKLEVNDSMAKKVTMRLDAMLQEYEGAKEDALGLDILMQ